MKFRVVVEEDSSLNVYGVFAPYIPFLLIFLIGALVGSSANKESVTPTDGFLCECTSGAGIDTSTTQNI